MMLSDVCLSRSSGLSRKQLGLGRLKLAHSWTPLSRSKGQRPTCRGRGHIVSASHTACLSNCNLNVYRCNLKFAQYYCYWRIFQLNFGVTPLLFLSFLSSLIFLPIPINLCPLPTLFHPSLSRLLPLLPSPPLPSPVHHLNQFRGFGVLSAP